MSQRRGGLIQLQVAGVSQEAKGNFTYNLGRPKRETIVGSDGVHGFKETPQPSFIEGEITDRGSLDLGAFVGSEGVTVTLGLANGKTIVLKDAWYCGDGTGNSDEGNIAIRFESKLGEEIA
jgi:hypothetical protein